jgi:two-component system sensor histidine kinase/response regulator
MISNDISKTSSILIVDDNPQNLQVLGNILLENNYKIEFSTRGEAALEWFKTRSFDLILLDINMPGMDGFEVCRQIRSNHLMDNVPVIFLSASADRESILKGFDLGAQDYITKPFDSRELLVRVRTHLVLKDSLERMEVFNRSLEEKVAERTRQLSEANTKMEALNTRLLDLDKAKSGFLNLISHEIRTPLNGILGPLELLKGTDLTGEIGDLVEMLDTSVKRLEQFSLNAILITRLKAKHIEIKREKLHLSDLIREVLDEQKEKFRAGNLQVKLSNGLATGLFSGEAVLIKKCIINILDNAVRFSPKDGAIEIVPYDENKQIICEIRDNGKGFTQKVIDKAFDLFTTDEEYKDNSIGIGLPVAKMIMELHGGEIVIGNNPEGGASVKLIFRNMTDS